MNIYRPADEKRPYADAGNVQNDLFGVLLNHAAELRYGGDRFFGKAARRTQQLGLFFDKGARHGLRDAGRRGEEQTALPRFRVECGYGGFLL